MQRTITVKGTGKLTAKPDYIVLSMTLEARAEEYSNAVELSATQLGELSDSLGSAGFEKASLKTTDFNVRTDYQHVPDENGSYYNKFNGFVCGHQLKLEFDFETTRLAQALNAITSCIANPQLNVSFTVKDPDAISATLLKSAAANAREKADILCDASGVTLGQLITIDYNQRELDAISRTGYSLGENRLRSAAPMKAKAMDMSPDDIDISDTATFVWEIK